MCREDLRIGRKKFTKVSIVTVPFAAPAVVISQAKNRTHIRAVCGPTRAFLSPITDGLTSLAGFGVTSNPPYFEFDIETDGNVVTQQWSGIGDGSDATMILVETFFDDTVYP